MPAETRPGPGPRLLGGGGVTQGGLSPQPLVGSPLSLPYSPSRLLHSIRDATAADIWNERQAHGDKHNLLGNTEAADEPLITISSFFGSASPLRLSFSGQPQAKAHGGVARCGGPPDLLYVGTCLYIADLRITPRGATHLPLPIQRPIAPGAAYLPMGHPGAINNHQP